MTDDEQQEPLPDAPAEISDIPAHPTETSDEGYAPEPLPEPPPAP